MPGQSAKFVRHNVAVVSGAGLVAEAVSEGLATAFASTTGIGKVVLYNDYLHEGWERERCVNRCYSCVCVCVHLDCGDGFARSWDIVLAVDWSSTLSQFIAAVRRRNPFAVVIQYVINPYTPSPVLATRPDVDAYVTTSLSLQKHWLSTFAVTRITQFAATAAKPSSQQKQGVVFVDSGNHGLSPPILGESIHATIDCDVVSIFPGCVAAAWLTEAQRFGLRIYSRCVCSGTWCAGCCDGFNGMIHCAFTDNRVLCLLH
jgi:hypothetical protein